MTGAPPSKVAAARSRYTDVRSRADATTAGRVARRVKELDVMNHALIMASLSFTILFPAIITLAALLPLGPGSGVASGIARRLGLDAQATHDLLEIFPQRTTAEGSVTAVSAVFTVFFAVGWPAELQRGYQAIWDVPNRGLRDLWRPMLWLVTFFGLLSLAAWSGGLRGSAVSAFVTCLVALPLLFGWTWWTQRLLLGGRVSWRALRPGAVVTTVALVAFMVAMRVYIPNAIVHNTARYGPIGVVFALLSWVIGFAFVMLGGPLAGHTIVAARASRRAASEPTPQPQPRDEALPAGDSPAALPANDSPAQT